MYVGGWALLWAVVVGFSSSTSSGRCEWHERHEPNVVLVEVQEGAPVGVACSEEHGLLAVLDATACRGVERALLGRHRRASLGAPAPYRLQLHVALPWSCHRLLIEVGGGTPYELAFDADDDFEALAAATCGSLGADASCGAAVAAEMRRRPAVRGCPAARARRLAGEGHACAGPWARVAGAPETSFLCAEASCLVHNLYLHDGAWYAVGESPPPVVRLGTRPDTQELVVATASPSGGSVLGLPERDLHVLLARWQPFGSGEGHGHALHDAALPVFWAMLALNATTAPERVRLVLLDGDLAAPSDVWLETVASRPPLYAHELSSFLCPPHAWCVLPRVLVGLENLSYFADGGGGVGNFGPVHESFALYARAALRVDTPASSSRVLVVQRLHSRVLENAADIADAFQERGWEVIVGAMDFLSPRAQVDLFNRVDLVVAVEGGALDLLLLAPPGLAVVVIGRNPAVPWPDGCSGCDEETQFTHGPMLRAAASWLPSARVPCGGNATAYAPDPEAVLEAAAEALLEGRRRRRRH